MKRTVRYIVMACGMLLLARTADSQTMMLPESVPGDTVVTAFIPAAAYASDIGLIGGMVVNRYRYHPLAQPYVSLTEVRARISTKLFVDVRVMYEQTETFGRPIRSRWIVYGERHPFDHYFGIGNRTVFDSSEWDDSFYNYEVMRAGLEWHGRRAVYHSDRSRGRLDITGSAAVTHEIPDDNPDRFIGQDRPEGISGGWVNPVGLGLLWENRDSEFAATRGNRFELTGTWAPGFLLSDYSMGTISADLRQYVTLPVPWFRPVFAMRTSGSRAFGSVPYWKRPHLGDENTLRGYPLFRFRGDASLFYNLELRSWIYEYEPYDFKLGIHGFHDAGRVFGDRDGPEELFRDYHRTIGGGVATALFTPDFILRIEVGFSDEMYRLYMNVGYMF